MTREFLERLRKERTTYREMIEFCCDSLILNNYIYNELLKNGVEFGYYCGNDTYFTNEKSEEITEQEYYELIEQDKECYEEHKEIYQYYIISARDADRVAEFTNEIVLYNDDLELYLLCVTHFRSGWSIVPSNWKSVKEIEEE